jgi:Ribosomal protein L30p/L7e
LIGLGLNKIGRVNWVPDTPASRGIISKVSHLVKINHDPSAPNKPCAPAAFDEASDMALMRKLIFEGKNVTLVPFSHEELKQAKCPDFKLTKKGNLCGYCEVKFPRDEFIFGKPAPGEWAIRNNLPYHVKLGRLIRKAALQLTRANPDHTQANILVFVNHAPEMEMKDLHATIRGLPMGNGKWLPVLCRKLQEHVLEAATEIDIFLWIDAEKGTLQHVSVVGAPHQRAALDLLNLSIDEKEVN